MNTIFSNEKHEKNITYHTNDQIWYGNRDLNNGILIYKNEVEYDPEKSCLKYYKENKTFDFVENGNYLELKETGMLTEDEISALLNETSKANGGILGFELSVVSIAIVSIALYYKKKH